MLYKEYIKIDQMSVHRIGNKAALEGVELSEAPVELDEGLSEILKSYFLMAFKDEERYCFSHATSLELNAVYSYIHMMFEDRDAFHEQSVNLAKYLYEKSEHPNIKRGDFYVIYFKDCILNGETIDVVGLFKSENKDTFIQINPVAGGFRVASQTGMSINRLDKGCLIFNLNGDDGYVACVVDNANRSDAKYWVNDFLELKRIEDDYRQTEQAVKMCKGFISHLPEEYDKAQKAVMMNKVMETLDGENVSVESIAEKAFAPVGAENAFRSYADDYQSKQEMSFKESFQGKASSMSQRGVSRVTKVRLDDNFEVRILKGEENLERGYDEGRGLNYYKLYFSKEK